MGREPSSISLREICVHALDHREIGSQTFAVWKELLGCCYHEFGHQAAASQLGTEPYQHSEQDQRAHAYAEGLAEAWKRRRLLELRDRDPRIAQPNVLGGYLGMMLPFSSNSFPLSLPPSPRDTAKPGAAGMKHRDRWARFAAKVGKEPFGELQMEGVYLLTGNQLLADDVMYMLGLDPGRYSNAHKLLAAASEGVGRVFADELGVFGRDFRGFAWGDVPHIANRVEALLAGGFVLKRRHAAKVQRRQAGDEDLGPGLMCALAAADRLRTLYERPDGQPQQRRGEKSRPLWGGPKRAGRKSDKAPEYPTSSATALLRKLRHLRVQAEGGEDWPGIEAYDDAVSAELVEATDQQHAEPLSALDYTADYSPYLVAEHERWVGRLLKRHALCGDDSLEANAAE